MLIQEEGALRRADTDHCALEYEHLTVAYEGVGE